MENKEIEKIEKAKYEHAWKCLYTSSSGCVIPLAKHVAKNADIKWKLLDIGCGNGITVYELRKKGFNCKGTDITLNALKEDKKGFIEAPIWRMPFKDNEFDFTFSTDVMEHLPTNMIDESIKEIYRITRFKTFHCIPSFNAKRGKIILHLTVKPVEWWIEKFKKLNTKNISTKIMNRRDFLKTIK